MVNIILLNRLDTIQIEREITLRFFETMWRIGFWQKLIKNNISWKMLRVILCFYADIESGCPVQNILS
jgi:hypothetical protein